MLTSIFLFLQENNYKTLNHFYIALRKQKPLIWATIWMASTTTREYAGCLTARLPVCSKSNLWGSCQRSGGISCSQPFGSRFLCLWGQHASPYLFTLHGSDRTHNPKETFALIASQAIASCLTLILMIVSGIPAWNKGLSLKLLKHI